MRRPHKFGAFSPYKKVEDCRLLRISDLQSLGFKNLATIFLKIGENDLKNENYLH